jgi:hypothetical protein
VIIVCAVCLVTHLGSFRLAGDKWPADFPANMPAKAYNYDSTNPVGLDDGVAELLYITQTSTPKSKKYAFQLGPEVTDMHLEVGYNFGLGDMAMILTHKDSGDKYNGVNGYNRNYITQTNLLPGQYELLIYEPAANHVEYLKCSYFTFEAHIVQGGKGTVINPEQPTLPAVLDLNSVPYLYYEGYTHFQVCNSQEPSFLTPLAFLTPCVMDASVGRHHSVRGG